MCPGLRPPSDPKTPVNASQWGRATSVARSNATDAGLSKTIRRSWTIFIDGHSGPIGGPERGA